jgi:hypothetical protein
MVDYGSDQIKSLVFSLTSPATATSGNVTTDYNPIQIVGRIVGIEVGSPAFGAATGSMWVTASGATFAQTREVARVNGVGQARAYYPMAQYQRDAATGTAISGLGGCKVEYPLVDGEQVCVSVSGCYGGAAVKVIVRYI